MRHGNSGKKLGRDSAHRTALYSNLTGALFEHGRIKTTVTKAKAVKPLAEQMITLGRRGDLHARRQAVAFLRSKDVVHKLFDEIGPRFKDRPGGYARIIKIGPRQGDAAEMAYLELVDEPVVFKTRAAAAAAGSPEPVAADEPEAEAEADEAVDDTTDEDDPAGEEPAAESEPEVVAAAPADEPESAAETAADAGGDPEQA